MSAYRLYTVVPRLVKFIGDLTNVYVRYNRKRLKGGKSREDCLLALASLYQVLLTLCKVIHPSTSWYIPFWFLQKLESRGRLASTHKCCSPLPIPSAACYLQVIDDDIFRDQMRSLSVF